MRGMGRRDVMESSIVGRGLPVALALMLVSASPLALAQSASRPRAAAPRPAPSQPAEPVEQEDDTTGAEVVVQGVRVLAGSVVGDVKPEITLAPQEIRSYGVSTVTDLLAELAPQTSTGPGSGPPVILLNGRRISGFNEVREIPTEAILRVEILPQEAALKFGYSADQRVVNIVLRPFFRAKTAELDGGGPTEGGQVQGQGQLDYMRIRRDTRMNVALKAQTSTAITEDERDVIQPTEALPFDPQGNVVAATPGATASPGSIARRTTATSSDGSMITVGESAAMSYGNRCQLRFKGLLLPDRLWLGQSLRV